ncbi:SUMF1/EgtB/PvdO family nonheme iron enzyme [Oceanicoccus sp. KOV_DT_Chl]|uniref:SUMF1/EgtB/PvdO family nonheme iron enzyme n=1 Tax=Oceanicoccus sp. KOV_DT_Chl TaxID=1904639 RepID=UPI000C7D7CDC|nr:SUMF1/EgtB/PvdO family nonheme iron enzyme [Oceanicoccus sp. KOV_DT_Chl]
MLIGQLPEVGDDVYAVGCVAYELFTGKHPFSKKNAVDAKKAGMKPARIKSLSARQWKALRKALAFKREDRYPSVKEFWEEFDHRVSPVWLVAGIVLLIVAGTAVWSVEQNSRLDGVDEEAIRLQADQDNTYSNLQAWIKREPISRVENDLRVAYGRYQKLVPATDEKLLASQQQIVALYLAEAESLREAKQFDDALARLATALSWQAEAEQTEQYQQLLAAINRDMEAQRIKLAKQEAARIERERLAKAAAAAAERDRLAAIERQQMAAAAKEREIKYQAALAKVEATLSCQTVPDFNNLQQQLNALAALDATRAKLKTSEFSEQLALCVKRVANSNPVAGKVAQASALTIFPESALLQGLVIDPCASNKLSPGSGRRDSKFCIDRFANIAGPKMVIVKGVDGGKSYAIGKYEITAREFGVYCQAGNDCSGITDIKSDLPVRQLAIAQAQAYAAWLSENTGFDYRLPTYAEWLNAAKAGGRSKNLDPNCTVKRVNGTRSGDELRVAGGGFNDWGLYNVVGNVQEWTVDGASIAAAGGRHTDRLADVACTVDYKEAHSGRPDAVTGFRLVRGIKR